MSAVIVDLCPHGQTARFCPDCRDKTSRSDRAARRAISSWTSGPDPAGPRTMVTEMRPCPWCAGTLDKGDMAYKRKTSWVCASCAEEYDGS